MEFRLQIYYIFNGFYKLSVEEQCAYLDNPGLNAWTHEAKAKIRILEAMTSEAKANETKTLSL